VTRTSNSEDEKTGISWSVGVDTGGTFTDLIVRMADKGVAHRKVLSTPDDPSRAIVSGIDSLVSEAQNYELVHGTTVATNAILERRGARIGFITTRGFEDLLMLRRQNRPDLYALDVKVMPPLAEAGESFGVDERILSDGSVERPLTARACDEVVAWVVEKRFQAVAISLLHSYASDKHEQILGERLGAALPDLHISLSSEVLPVFREYERSVTTCVNAYVGPLMTAYLRNIVRSTSADSVEIMLSNGGRSDVDVAASFPVQTVLSGPAGGVVGARSVGRQLGIEALITFDMGGTSTDVSVCDGDPAISTGSEVGGHPIGVPMLDIFTVGAGGGSIAYRDAGGALRVGPRSAGSQPGPACYGNGGVEPTVTDAHVILGRLPADRFLGGGMTLDRNAAHRSVDSLAQSLGMPSQAVAAGILDVADATMIRAIKVVSIERGLDPRGFTLISYGGAGGLHACRVANALEIGRVIVPAHPGLLSAAGMLESERVRYYTKMLLSDLMKAIAKGILARTLEEIAIRATAESPDARLTYEVALRYQGQSHPIFVPIRLDAAGGWCNPGPAFEERHERLYGYRSPGRAIKTVEVRARACSTRSLFPASLLNNQIASQERPLSRVYFPGQGMVEIPIVERSSLAVDEVIDGPCIVVEYSGTTVVEPGWRACVTPFRHLVLTREGEG
jgi:N-methylhydantoinase A